MWGEKCSRVCEMRVPVRVARCDPRRDSRCRKAMGIGKTTDKDTKISSIFIHDIDGRLTPLPITTLARSTGRGASATRIFGVRRSSTARFCTANPVHQYCFP